MPRAVAVPPDLLRRPFTVAEGLQRGVPQPVLEGPRFRRPHRGVRVPRELPDSPAVRAASASLALPPRAALTGWTPLVLLGLPTPLHDRDPSRGLVTARVPEGVTAPRVVGTRCGTGLRDDRVVLLVVPQVRLLLRPGHRGLRTQTPEDAWCEVAPTVPFADAVALGDAVHRHHADDAQIADAVAARDGTPGVEVVRRVAAAVRARVDSPMESHTRLLYLGAGLPEPECGLGVLDHRGRTWFVDLCWPAWRVIVEYDGDGHRTGDFDSAAGPRLVTAAAERAAREQWQRDSTKRQALRDSGWEVVVVTADGVLRRPRETVEELRRALRAAGAPV